MANVLISNLDSLTAAPEGGGVLTKNLGGLVLSTTNSTSSLGNLTLDLDTCTLTILGGSSGELLCELDSFDIEGVSGTTGSLCPFIPENYTLDSFEILAEASGTSGNLNKTIDTFSINALALGTVGSFDNRLHLDRLSLSASGNTSTIGSLSDVIDALELTSIIGTSSSFGSLTSNLDSLIILGQGVYTDEDGAEIYECVVLNMDNWSVTTYTGFNFHSMTEFDGKVLLANSIGIYEFIGGTDAGVAIDSTIQTGVDDGGSTRVKREPEVLVGLKSGGEMQVAQVMDEVVSGYDTIGSTSNKYTSKRVKAPLAPIGRYLGVKVVNKDGSDFTLDALTLRCQITDRDVS